jgi:murein DD-endopeptidase MepM/ murein hydrolase activator NlpD
MATGHILKKITLMIIPDGIKNTRQIRIPAALISALSGFSIIFFGFMGFFVVDYIELRAQRHTFQYTSTENEVIKGEARLLEQNLDEVKQAIRRVRDYSVKLAEITTFKVKSISEKTGIGPLTPEEYQSSQNVEVLKDPTNYLPSGLNTEKLVFRPVFETLEGLGKTANQHALDLQHLLSNLSQQKSLLASIPSVRPVDGWITSNFGKRISPFTGQKTTHLGIDIASPVGTPIYAPADGVVIFSGAKEGFGNFIMIAHGYGLVTRYGHNHQNMVQPGHRVLRGEQIATVGMSGRTTGPHLHYEILVNGKYENPGKFILDITEFQDSDVEIDQQAIDEAELNVH